MNVLPVAGEDFLKQQEMIECTGILNGKMVEAKVVSAKELIEQFKLPIDPSKQSKVDFRLDNTQVAINLADGKERFSDTRLYKPIIIGSYNGDNYIIRYYKSKVPGDKGTAKYSPNRVSFLGSGHSVRIPDNLEEAVMFALFPSCADSPFRDRFGKVDYRIAQPLEEAQGKLRVELMRGDVREQILKGSDEWIIQVTSGINLLHGMIDLETAQNHLLARVALLELATKDLNFVVDALDSVQIKAAGIAAKAIEQRQVVLASQGAGQRAWYFSQHYGSKLICNAPVTKDANQALMMHLAMPDEREEFLVTLGMKPKRGGEIVDIDYSDEISIIDGGYKMGLFNIHPVELKVYAVKNGQFDGRPLCQTESLEDWLGQMKEKRNAIMVNRIKSLIKNAD